MGKRDDIIKVAAKLIRENGYHNIGIKSILDELSIPKGSFYHYFKSKEELGLAIIEIYTSMLKKRIEEQDNSLDGLKRLFNIYFDQLLSREMKNGCPVGNLILELSDENETFRHKLLEWYNYLENWTIDVLKNESIKDAEKKAKVLISAFEGAMLISKLDKDAVHFELFNEITFNAIVNQ